jgi:pimeloyl-ACP methyl ester carboxylesterase
MCVIISSDFYDHLALSTPLLDIGKRFHGRLEGKDPHHVIAFDNRGVGASTGTVPRHRRVDGRDAYTFIKRSMVPSSLSEDMHRRIAGSNLTIYPDSGHGAIFQYRHEFASTAIKFIDD